MPTYEYECRACHHTFEKFQSMSDEPVKVCPKCGSAVRRKIGGGLGVIFKGSGFYCTDSKKTSSAALTDSSSGSSSVSKENTATATAGAATGAVSSPSPGGGSKA